FAGLKQEAALYTKEHEGVTVHRFRPGGRVMQAFNGLGRWKCWWTRQRLENSWGMYHALKSVMRGVRFDVLEMPECGAEGFLINSLIRVPTIVRFHSPSRLIMQFYDVPQADINMCSWIEQRAIMRATALTSCSRFLAGEVRDKMGVGSNISVIPNGIDLDLFDQERCVEVADKYRVPKDKPTIFF